jgi:phosphatidylglycerol lysyltransferase
MVNMKQPRSALWLTRTVAYIVIAYGLGLITAALFRQLRAHPGHHLDVLLITVPQIVGLGFVYLGNLLRRRKYNAWLAAMVLFGVSLILEFVHMLSRPDHDDPHWLLRFLLPVLIVSLLWLSRSAFRVQSDLRSFTKAVQFSVVVLLIALVYGVVGFILLDKHDFHQEIAAQTAVHMTIDQFGLTTDHAVAHTRRARLFLDSLSVISIAAVAYAAVAFFDPIRVRLSSQSGQREHVERLLKRYPSDIDDFFKLWPHDKSYYFDKSGEAGLAFHVSAGVALVVGNPFGDPKRYKELLANFTELCFVNDWLPAFVHVSDRHSKLYSREGFQLQKIGAEAVVDLSSWPATQSGKKGKHFREIRNRFTRLGYRVEIVKPPFSAGILGRLGEISEQWLEKPGREERGLMLGYHDDAYLQQGALALIYDEAEQIQGFLNLVPTYTPGAANYDLLRCSEHAPGNSNDFLLMEVFDALAKGGVKIFNLGLSPLAGLHDGHRSEDNALIGNALRFVYSNGDRLYSFSGLHRFKDKYRPDWQDRYIAYPGGVRNFTRILAALSRAMKIKNKHPR